MRSSNGVAVVGGGVNDCCCCCCCAAVGGWASTLPCTAPPWPSCRGRSPEGACRREPGVGVLGGWGDSNGGRGCGRIDVDGRLAQGRVQEAGRVVRRGVDVA